MTAKPWTKWFWSDWRAEPTVRACSLAARGLWMDLLAIAADHEPIGYVCLNGISCTHEDISRLTGNSLAEIIPLIQELETKGVFGRDRAGRIYSRRMVKDAKKAQTARENGEKGGNPTLLKDTAIPKSDKLKSTPGLRHPLSLARSIPEERVERGLSGESTEAGLTASPVSPVRTLNGHIINSTLPRETAPRSYDASDFE